MLDAARIDGRGAMLVLFRGMYSLTIVQEKLVVGEMFTAVIGFRRFDFTCPAIRLTET